MGDIFLPRRTMVEVRGQVPLHQISPDGRTILKAENLEIIGDYHCLDCKFQTGDPSLMEDHQIQQEKYHNLFQRLKRWVSLLER